MYFINHKKKIIVFCFHKCGHTSLIDYFDQIENFKFVEVCNYPDSYTHIKNKFPQYLDYNMAMVIRNPIHYSISGYKHFINAKNSSKNYKKFIDNIMTLRYDVADYTYKKHLELVISPTALMNPTYHMESNAFYNHCCVNPRYTFRKNIKIIQLENTKDLSVFLKTHHVSVHHTVSHKNKNDYQPKIFIDNEIIMYWKNLYYHNFKFFGYNFEKTVEEFILKS
jgi:hypothetical protein